MSSYELGIDTSSWQKSLVDYKKFREAGGSFALLRIGCGSTKDKCFELDYKAAVAAGLKVGVYLYTYSKTVAEATADATRVLGWLADRHLDFPVVYDLEDSRQKGTSRQNLNANMYNAFKEKIEETCVYDAILYTGEYFYNNYINKSLVTDDLWIAKYSKVMPSVGRDVAIWQFTSDAIATTYYNGELDRNYLLGSFKASREALVKVNTNPYPEPTRTIQRKIPMQQGNDVKWVQWELGMSETQIDGKFGDTSKKILGEYQKQHGLKVDYKCGPATRYQMKND